ncbi:protein Big1p [[Candida] anglica]|uniref:Protein BIG1 n=1 Tax=[Candida] anglica TaxID=148631 RepID=A0ABP0E866_9ASCO
MVTFKVILGLICIGYVAAFSAVPIIVASHKLVPGLGEIEKDDEDMISSDSMTNMIKQLITECSSDVYVIVNSPGLRLEDIRESEKENWPHTRKYLHMASTVKAYPWVDSPLDLQYLEKYIIKTCQAETINVLNQDDNEVNEYIDVRTRVIKVQLNELSNDPNERVHSVRGNDELLRKILRKLPSPHYTLIITSDTPSEYHPIPNIIIQENPKNFEIFNDIVNDPLREIEVERNNNFHKVEPIWSPPRHTNDRYLRNKKKDEIHVFDFELWQKNEKLIMTILMMIIGLIFIKFTSIVKFFVKRIKTPVRKGPLLEVRKDE